MSPFNLYNFQNEKKRESTFVLYSKRCIVACLFDDDISRN